MSGDDGLMAGQARHDQAPTLAYPVHVQRGLLPFLSQHVSDAAPAHRYVVVIDETVLTCHGDKLRGGFPSDRTLVLTVPPGEREKSRERWAALTDDILQWGAGRDTTIVAVGGGVVCDLAGFVAATFMRGVPVVQVPTTLLAMVDASVGGKTGVDTGAGKNLVGAFHNPSAVIIDPDVLTTLPSPVFRSGLAEMIKHGVLASREYFDAMLSALPKLAAPDGAVADELPALIAQSVAIKAAVVARDEREGGLRQTLNFGHTIAHALELQFNYSMLHGDAVAIGMVVEAEIAERLSIAEAGTVNVVQRAVGAAGLPLSVPASVNLDDVLSATLGDKKSRGGLARYALPTRIGEMTVGDGSWSVAVDNNVVAQALRAHSV
ncbi:MAG: 3-dehydroquinate synthase [Phycisphaerae bacterium]|nr:3-dehydroquinate synthase [Gemmatimonadaceae bacterium]